MVVTSKKVMMKVIMLLGFLCNILPVINFSLCSFIGWLFSKLSSILEQEVTKPAEHDTNMAEGDGKLEEQGAGTLEKKEPAPST